jgi:hypothetical protein
MTVSETYEDIRRVFMDAIGRSHEAQTRYAKFADYEKKMCVEWIAAAPAPELRDARIRQLADTLRSFSFDPMYYLGQLTFFELERLYGPPKHLNDLAPAEQALAIDERRVLEAFHTRNYDDSRVVFGVVEPGTLRRRGSMLAFARPCVLTAHILDWLDYNGWDTLNDAERFLFG